MKALKVLSLTVLMISFLTCSSLFGLPEIPEKEDVENGSATFEMPDPSTLNITVSDKAVINFNSFNIAVNETVNIIQPSADASVLNRVTGPGATEIYGRLFANGIVFLINPNGIHIGPDAQIDVNNFIASTLDISTNNFINGNYILEHNVNSQYSYILNEGRITGNNIALIASAVNNTGIIAAKAGTVHLASGDKVTVSFDARGLLQVEINEATSGKVMDLDGNTVKDAVANSKTIEATQVVMSAKTASDIFENAVNLTGVIKATGMIEEGGIIRITSNKNIRVSGTLEAYTTATPGHIEIISNDSVAISAELATKGNTIITSNNDINVNADIATDSGNLDLIADADLDGIGAFKQAQDTLISTINYGDITIQSSGEGTLANIASSGDLTLRQGGAQANFTQQPNSRISTRGSFRINSGVSLNAGNAAYEIGKNFIVSGNFIPQVSTVSLVSSQEAIIKGIDMLYNFSIIVPDKIVNFDTEKTITIIGTLTLKGEYGHLLVLKSLNAPEQWSINPQGETDIVYVLVGDSINIRGPPLKGLHSDSLGNLINWDLDPYWTGQGANNNWSNPNNWDTGTVPTSTSDVTFDGTAHGVPGANPNKASIIDIDFTIGSLTINGYTGTITQNADLVITNSGGRSGSYSQSTGTFRCIDPVNYTFFVSGSFSIAGGTFNRYTGSGTQSDPYIVRDVYDLQAIKCGLAKHYQLNGNIDASSTSGWNSGAGFEPIGNFTSRFTGSLNGQNYTITGLYINRPTTNYIGLFGFAGPGAEISNISLIDNNITGAGYVGGLIGGNMGSVSNSYATGSVSCGANGYGGGLIGFNYNQGTISDSYTTGTVTALYYNSWYIGGLLGFNGGLVTRCYSAAGLIVADLTAFGYSSFVGGLVGYNSGFGVYNGVITYSFATGNISGNAWHVGGLVGRSFYGTISNSYATGNVQGYMYVGGFIGSAQYATISNCYSVGYVSAPTSYTGGFISYVVGGSITNCFWDIETSGRPTSAGGTGVTGRTTAQMMSQATFTGWTFDGSNWGITANETYPYLSWKYPSGAHAISGIVYTDNGTTNIGPNLTIVLVIDGIVKDMVRTGKNGRYYFLRGDLAGGNTVLVYINSGTTKGNTVTTLASAGVTNLDIYRNTVIARHEGSGSITNLDFSDAKGALNNSYILFSVAGPDLILNSGIDFIVWSNKTYTPGGNLTCDDLTIQSGATYNAGNSQIFVSGNWTNNGVFIAGTSIVTFNGTGMTNTINSGNQSFNILNIDSANGMGIWTLDTNNLTAQTLNVTRGTLNVGAGKTITVTGTLTINGGNITGTGANVRITANTINHTLGVISTIGSGNIYLYGNGAFLLNRINSAGSITIGDTDLLTPSLVTLTGIVEAVGMIVIVSEGDLNIDADLITTGGAIWLFSDEDSTGGGSFVQSASALITCPSDLNIFANGSSNIIGNIRAGALYLSYGNNASPTYTLTDNTSINLTSGGLNIHSPVTFNAGYNTTITIFGTFNSSGVFNGQGSTITFNGNIPDRWIKLLFGAFNNLTFDGPGSWYMDTYDFTVNGDFRINQGTFRLNEKTLTVKGDFVNSGNFIAGTGRVIFNGAGTQDITPGSSSFYNVTIAPGAIINMGAIKLTVTNNLTNNGTLNMQDYNLLVTGLDNSGQIIMGSGDIDLTNPVNIGSFKFTSARAIPDYNYGALELAGAGTYNAQGNITSSLTLSNALSILDMSNYNLNVSTLNNAGTIVIRGGSVSIPSGAVGNFTFTDTNTIPSATYSTLIIDALSKTLTIGGDIGVTNLLINNGTLNGNGRTITVSGDWVNNGTFIAGAGTAIFNGTGTITSAGSSFYNITFNNPLGIWNIADPMNVLNDFTLTAGTVNQNDNLTIQHDYSQAAGSFISDINKAFLVGNSFSISAGTFKRFTGSGTSPDPYLIYDVYGLQAMKCYLSSYFKLNNDINASSTSNWNSGAGFVPVGTNSSRFSGNFNGDNKIISGLYINRPTTDYVGLFGYADTTNSISNIGMLNVDIRGRNNVGALVGRNVASISNSYATGSVSGSYNVGGLVGYNNGSISNSYATGNANGIFYVGGLVGYNNGPISNSYATGNVSGSNYVGGLVGYNSNFSSISNSYATGNVSGSNYIGGLVGYNIKSISNSYATGSVNGLWSYVGGLVGYNNTGSISNSYAIGRVIGSLYFGGLVGYDNNGTITNSYYDGQTTGQSDIGKGTPKTTVEMMAWATFTGWDQGIWGIEEGKTYPYHDWRYPNGAHGISGYVYSDQGSTGIGIGANVALIINGTLLTTAQTGLSNMYYFLLDNDQLSTSNNVLVYIDNNATRGNTVTFTDKNGIFGLNIYGNTVIARHETGSSITNSSFNLAKGSLNDTDILYSLSGSDLTLDATSGANLLIWAGKTYAPNGNITLSGNWTNNGTFDAGTGTVIFNGNTTVRGSNATSFNSIIINNGATLTSHPINMNVAGSWTNNGTFNHNNGTVTFIGANQSNISGNTIFYNLYCDIAGKTLRFDAGSTQTIAGTLTLRGTSANRIILISSSPGSQWNINTQGARDISNVDVKDSNAITNITPTGSNKDSGNNTNWYLVDHFEIIGSNSQTAGEAQWIIIRAIDGSGGISTSYFSNKNFIFSGASSSGEYNPNIDGTAFGSNTTITFTAGEGRASLTLYKAETTRITATDGTISPPLVFDIIVSPAVVNSINFVTQPANTQVNLPLSPITVELRDAWDNLCTNDNVTILTASLNGGMLSGTLSQIVSSGNATFNNLTVNSGGNYTIIISTITGVSATSSSFVITSNPSAISNPLIPNAIPVFPLPDTIKMPAYQINELRPAAAGPVYFYQPLTLYDISVFEDMTQLGQPVTAGPAAAPLFEAVPLAQLPESARFDGAKVVPTIPGIVEPDTFGKAVLSTSLPECVDFSGATAVFITLPIITPDTFRDSMVTLIIDGQKPFTSLDTKAISIPQFTQKPSFTVPGNTPAYFYQPLESNAIAAFDTFKAEESRKKRDKNSE